MLQSGDHRGVDKDTVISRLFDLSSTPAAPLKLPCSGEAPLCTVQTRTTWLILKSITEQGAFSSVATNVSPFLLLPLPPHHALCVW